MTHDCLNSPEHGKQPDHRTNERGLLALALAASAAAWMGTGARRWRADDACVENAVLGQHVLRVWLSAASEGAAWQYVPVDHGYLAAFGIKKMHDLASCARRLVHARIRLAFIAHNLGHASGEHVGEVESIEDQPKLSLGNPVDRWACHMSDEIPTAALSRYLGGALTEDALAAILEAENWDSTSGLASRALRLIYEFGNGDWTKPELRDQLRRLIEPRPVGFIFGIGAAGTQFGPKPAGIAIRRVSVAVGRTSEQAPQFRSEPHSGIGIGETRPVIVR